MAGLWNQKILERSIMIIPGDFGGNTAIEIDGFLSIHVLVLTFTAMAHCNCMESSVECAVYKAMRIEPH